MRKRIIKQGASGAEQAEKNWDSESIGSCFKKMVKEGIPRKKLNPEQIIANKQQILDRVQLRGEEYEFVSRN